MIKKMNNTTGYIAFIGIITLLIAMILKLYGVI